MTTKRTRWDLVSRAWHKGEPVGGFTRSTAMIKVEVLMGPQVPVEASGVSGQDPRVYLLTRKGSPL